MDTQSANQLHVYKQEALVSTLKDNKDEVNTSRIWLPQRRANKTYKPTRHSPVISKLGAPRRRGQRGKTLDKYFRERKVACNLKHGVNNNEKKEKLRGKETPLVGKNLGFAFAPSSSYQYVTGPWHRDGNVGGSQRSVRAGNNFVNTLQSNKRSQQHQSKHKITVKSIKDGTNRETTKVEVTHSTCRIYLINRKLLKTTNR